MCGICGFTGIKGNRQEIIKKMCDTMVHRGPDAEGFWMDENSGVTLGHRRLAIVDLTKNGEQPMASQSNRFVIAFNGEIYNAPKIKHIMEQEGYLCPYKGTSDTEIMLNAFEVYGIHETLKKMKGMFAVALLDRKEKKLFLMRDRAGEKPLFYTFVGEDFVFASEIQALKEFPGFQGVIQADAVKDFIRYGYIPAPATIYENVYKLMPGTIMTLEYPYNRVRSDCYWSMEEAALFGENNLFSGSFEEAAEQLDCLLTDSVREQMMADVPVGAYLSGGIDSATVVALMSKLNPGKVKTFSIGFEDKKYNEATFAKDIAEHLHTDHTELYVGEKELQSVIPLIPTIYGEPFGDSSQIPTYLVSKLAKEKVTVSLSGDAGDELFCGYQNYIKLIAIWKKIGKKPKQLRKVLGGAAAKIHFNNKKIYRGALCIGAENILQMKEAVAHTSPTMDVLAGGYEQTVPTMLLKDELSAMMLDDMLHYHPDDILVKVDRAGMAVSLENRIPMLDKDVMEFAWQIPSAYKYDGVTSKRILKAVLYRYVPKEMMDRPKKGFSVPLERWLREGDTATWAADLMLHNEMEREGFFSKEQIVKLWSGFQNKKEPARLVWNMLMLEQWYRTCHLS